MGMEEKLEIVGDDGEAMEGRKKDGEMEAE